MAVKFTNLAAHFCDGNVAIKAPDQLRRAVKKVAGVAKDWPVPVGVNPSPAALLSDLLLTLKKSESFHRFTGSSETMRVAAEAPLLPRAWISGRRSLPEGTLAQPRKRGPPLGPRHAKSHTDFAAASGHRA